MQGSMSTQGGHTVPEPDDAPVTACEGVFPQLHDGSISPTPLEPIGRGRSGVINDDDEDYDNEPAVAKPFVRTSSPDSAPRRPATASTAGLDGHGADDKVPDWLLYKMHKFSLYETASRYYIVGVDVSESYYRILKIDRTTEGAELNVTDDKIVYSLTEMNQLLDTIDDGNRGTGGIKLRCTTWGLLGFIKFTGPYYMLLITKKSTVAMVGGHYIYQIEGTELVPLTPGRSRPDPRTSTEEQRFLGILNNLDLTKSFYYSYSYDVTRTLQHNITRERAALGKGTQQHSADDFNPMFVWNDYLLQPAISTLKAPYDWCRPIIHGYIDQAGEYAVAGVMSLSFANSPVSSALHLWPHRTYHRHCQALAILCRREVSQTRCERSGTYSISGVSYSALIRVQGYVANDVETEQIVAESLTTSFHAPGPRLFCSPQYTSYVQHRGSIPLYWTQDSTGVTPKPPIEVNLIDPFYGAAALHFNNLFARYGAPIYVVNLIKSKERHPRESKLLEEYTNAIDYLNQFLPADKKIIHKAWDMSRASKTRGGDVIGNLELIAESVVTTTGFFQNGDGRTSSMTAQNGVARTNCIDCLDRTNAAQFVIGKRALGHQLHALGILEDTSIDYDTDAVNLFTHMWHDHGDTIAVQYGGSQLVNTMETYRKINQWTSHSRDMIESFKRYYNNSFLDSQRQEAYNLFLGNYIFVQGQPMLWDLSTDYYLHHADPRKWSPKESKEYINWFKPSNLEKRVIPPALPSSDPARSIPVDFVDDYWLEYYRPATLSSFPKMFAYKMNSTIKYIPLKSTQDGRYDLSPFRVRTEGDMDADKKKAKKGTPVLSPADSLRANEDDAASIVSGQTTARGMSLQRWLQPVQDKVTGMYDGTKIDASGHMEADAAKSIKPTPLEKSKAAQWTFTKAVHDSLNPSVKEQEADDYEQYIRHPQNLPLVVSSDTPVDIDSSEYQEYVHTGWLDQGLMVTGSEEEGEVYAELLKVGENPLTVTNEDAAKKRYKAYRKWLRGKSFFKQQPLD